MWSSGFQLKRCTDETRGRPSNSQRRQCAVIPQHVDMSNMPTGCSSDAVLREWKWTLHAPNISLVQIMFQQLYVTSIRHHHTCTLIYSTLSAFRRVAMVRMSCSNNQTFNPRYTEVHLWMCHMVNPEVDGIQHHSCQQTKGNCLNGLTNIRQHNIGKYVARVSRINSSGSC